MQTRVNPPVTAGPGSITQSCQAGKSDSECNVAQAQPSPVVPGAAGGWAGGEGATSPATPRGAEVMLLVFCYLEATMPHPFPVSWRKKCVKGFPLSYKCLLEPCVEEFLHHRLSLSDGRCFPFCVLGGLPCCGSPEGHHSASSESEHST